MKKLLLIIAINFVCVIVFAQTKFIDIYFHYTTEISDKDVRTLVTEYQTKIKTVKPFSEYSDRIRLLGKKLSRTIVSVDKYDQPIYNQADIRSNHPIGSSLDIYIITAAPLYAKGGRAAGLPVIFAGSDITAAELLHETCHAIANLGDEYDTGIDMTFSERYVSKYPNLTLAYPVPEWEQIKKSSGDEKIGYYPGGLGSPTGIYHSYPTCLMRDVSEPLCPVCQYYVRESLKKILSADNDKNF
ncbi:MAG: hypothetical protein IKQ61_13220 [Spirochaetales bacterium]|nr:hypothetical protein [Spirochaetales bacterium]MBR6201213.1 hypothetical protein [Spirochaetales bacterium]